MLLNHERVRHLAKLRALSRVLLRQGPHLDATLLAKQIFRFRITTCEPSNRNDGGESAQLLQRCVLLLPPLIPPFGFRLVPLQAEEHRLTDQTGLTLQLGLALLRYLNLVIDFIRTLSEPDALLVGVQVLWHLKARISVFALKVVARPIVGCVERVLVLHQLRPDFFWSHEDLASPTARRVNTDLPNKEIGAALLNVTVKLQLLAGLVNGVRFLEGDFDVVFAENPASTFNFSRRPRNPQL